MAITLKAARSELGAARSAIDRMRESGEFESFEHAWKDFLSAIEKVWAKCERECKSIGSFPSWQARFSHIRRYDPLLRYLKHARNADHHTLQEIVSHEPGHRTLNPLGGGSWYIERLVISGGEVVEYKGDKPMVQRDYPSRVKLLPVVDRGRQYDTPTQHLDSEIPGASPVQVAMLAVQWYEDFLNQVENKFSGRDRRTTGDSA